MFSTVFAAIRFLPLFLFPPRRQTSVLLTRDPLFLYTSSYQLGPGSFPLPTPSLFECHDRPLVTPLLRKPTSALTNTSVNIVTSTDQYGRLAEKR
jgi:hypothetical protein